MRPQRTQEQCSHIVHSNMATILLSSLASQQNHITTHTSACATKAIVSTLLSAASIQPRNPQSMPGEKEDNSKPVTVYYDGSCPLCSREINWYKKRKGGAAIYWQDVSTVQHANVSEDLKTRDAMNRFHVRKSDGTLESGASAFSELWLQLPSLKIFGRIGKLPGVKQLGELLYRTFLAFRSTRK